MSDVDADVAATSVSSNFCIQSMIEVWAERVPHAVAMAASGRAPLTYKRLWQHMRTVIHALRAMGVARHDRVATVVPQGPELATAFLTVAAGASSAPLNPAYRAHEFDFYMSDLHAKALIMQAGLDSPARGVARARGIPIIELLPNLDAEAGIFTLTGTQETDPVDDGFAQSGDVALVLHTSGTTSRPKAVPLTHTNLCASAQNIAVTLKLTQSDRCLNIMPLFHIHGLIGGMLASLASGGSVVCAPGFYAPQFFAWLDEFRPTWYTAVPAMHQAIFKWARAHREMTVRCSLRLIRSSSAPLPLTVMAELEDLFRVPVIEAYGMTEASHQIASNPLPPRQRKMGSVGMATGSEIAIIDEQGKHVSAGKNGEIIIRGTNITEGYENHPEVNTEAFANGWFRTGDQGYLDEDGYLFITGRLKEMINRGGEKISPREVDDVLMDHPAVRQAVTFAVPHPTLGEDVAAAVVFHKKATTVERELQEFAASRLADFKVPRKVLIVDEIPRTATGKLQRIDLAKKFGLEATANGNPHVGPKYVLPRTAAEEKLVEIWSQVLGVGLVDVYDNFFALGGDSILAAQVISRVRKAMGVELSFLSFIETPTIAGMVKSLETCDRKFLALPTATRQPLSDNQGVPVSYAQERFLKQPEPGNAAHARPTFFRLTGRLDVASLKRSLDEIVRRHDVLRTSFSLMDGHWVQFVSPPYPVSLPVVDLSGLPEPRRSTEARRLSTEEADRPFNLARGSLLRATLLRLKNDEHMLLLAIHHIAFDGWSQGVLLRELGLLYRAFCIGQSSPLSHLSIQYADFAVWQRQWLQGKMLETQLSYWKKQLAGIPRVLSLPTDRPRSAVQTFRGARESIVLSPGLTKSVKLLSRRTEVSLFMTLLAAFQTLLYRYTGEADVSVGTFIANRPSLETESLIGCFANNLVLRTDLSGNPSFRELLGRVREVCSGAYAHQNLPFAKVVEELHPEPCLSHSPLFQVMFVLQNTPQSCLELPNLTIERYPAMDANRSNVDFTLELSEDAGCLTGFFEYSTDLFDVATMRRMVEHFRALLEGVVSNPDERLSALNLNSNAVNDPLARRARLVQRQSRLSAAQQAALAERLSGKVCKASEPFHALEYMEQDSAARTLKPTDRNIDQSAATFSADDRLNCRVSKTAPILAASRNRDLPLSFAQRRLWFLDQYEPNSSVYNIPSALRLKGSLDVAAFERSLSEIVRRHESLRTTFPTVDGEPVQVIAPFAALPLAVVDLRDCPESEREEKAQQLANEEARRPFDLARSPLFRSHLLRLGEDDYVLLLTMHHIVSDGWSMTILFREIAILYEAYVKGDKSPLAELPIQYADFAVWQRDWLQGEVLERQLSYWKEQLAGIPAVLNLPTDYPRPAVPSYRGAWRSIVLSKELTEDLKALSRKEGVTLFMTLLAAFQTLLYRYTEQDDIVVGSPIANRNRAEIEGLIGFFINTLVLRSKFSDNPTFEELLARVREMALGAYAHQDLPFEKLVEELHPGRSLNHTPLFQVLFNMAHPDDSKLDLSGLAVESVSVSNIESKFDLTVYAREQGNVINLDVVYRRDLFDDRRMSCFVQQYKYLLEQIVAAPQQSVQSYSLVTPESRPMLPDPGGALSSPPQELVTSRIFAWAKQLPTNAAICQGRQMWTYGELAQRADSLARRIVATGLMPGEVVAVHGRTSFGLIAAMTAAFLSGGVLLPLDPNLPMQRKQRMLREAKAKRLLYVGSMESDDAWLEETFASAGLFVDPQNGRAIESETEKDLQQHKLPAIDPDDPAYVFFTSGSTGVPKGVLGSHKGLSHFLSWQRETFAIGPSDRVAQLTALSFDAVLRDIFLPLTSGATLCLPDDDALGSGEIIGWLERQQITVLHAVPSLAQSWLAGKSAKHLGSLRWTFFMGEPLTEAFVRSWRSAIGPAGEIINFYGPTETTLIKCFYRVPDEIPPGVQPVGWPIPNTQVLILSGDNQLCGINEPGEIVLRTPFRTLGYINAPEENKKRFAQNPFRDDSQDVVYFTGDAGCYRPDGSVQILGRRDDQVKIHGVRIDPDEVTATLATHALVHSCVVLGKKNDHGESYLAAYVVAAGDETPTTAQLRFFLLEQLPAAMVPSVFVLLNALPLTPNGKIDREALPEPNQRIKADQNYVEPRTDIETVVAGIWIRVLKREKIGVHDNFFDLGGHSLLATQIVSRLRETLRTEISLRVLFEKPTVAGLSDHIEMIRHTRGATKVIDPLDEIEEITL